MKKCKMCGKSEKVLQSKFKLRKPSVLEFMTEHPKGFPLKLTVCVICYNQIQSGLYRVKC